MRRLAETCEAIAGTTKKLLKTGIVADYLKSRTVDEAAVSAAFLAGRPFPAWEDTPLQVGGRRVWRGGGEGPWTGRSQLEDRGGRAVTAEVRRGGAVARATHTMAE